MFKQKKSFQVFKAVICNSYYRKHGVNPIVSIQANKYCIASNYMPSLCLLTVYLKLKLCLPLKCYFLHKILEAER